MDSSSRTAPLGDLSVDVVEERCCRGKRSRVDLLAADLDPKAFLESDDTDLVDLHQALEEMERDDPQLVRVVELRFFAGLGNREIASALDTSLSTVERAWRLARARLHKRLGGAVDA